ncbi:MAG: recombinase family protein [Cyanobacteriota bacterium]|nr:recombinase family protein [Cyanobacteriota bacterium]
MVALGYIFIPTFVEQRDPQAGLGLQQAGATEVYEDWGSRLYRDHLGQHLKAGTLSSLWLYRLADLGDTLSEIHPLIRQLQQAGIPLHLVQPDGTVLIPQEAAMWTELLAELPTALQQRRLLQVHHQKRLAATPPPGAPPYGYRREKDRYVLDRRQAAIVKDFFEHFLLHGSLRESVRYLHKLHGKKISVATGRRWLSNPVYRGDLAYTDGATLRNTHSPILSRQEAAQIDRWLKRNQGIPRRSASAPRSLAGLVFCQTCQQGLRIIQVTQRQKTSQYRYLRCQTCRYSLIYETVLAEVIRHICEQLPQRSQGFDPLPLEAAKKAIEAQINRNDENLKELAHLQSQGYLDEGSLQQRRYHLQTENALLAQKLEQLPPSNLPEIAQTLSIQPFWHDLSEAERRRYFREFIRLVEVNPQGEVKLSFFF